MSDGVSSAVIPPPQLVALSLVAGIGLSLPLASPDHGYGPKCRTVYETSYKTTYETIYQVGMEWYGTEL